jgi:hypothetical protein
VTTSLDVVDHAPTGEFTLGFPTTDYKVTMSEVALADDITPTANLQVTVDWGDKTAPEAWVGQSMTHQYPLPETPTTIDHYTPTVTITDTASPKPNTTVLHPGNVVINDHTAPTGSFALSLPTRSVWARYTRVSLSQSNVSDGLGSAPQNIVRTVDWGDKSPKQSWTSGSVPTHRYAAAGQYPVTVTLQDEAGNKTAPTTVGTVTVKADTAAPRVTIKLPARPRNVIKKWGTLRGTARDAGVGVKVVHLQVVEKRGTTYYAYKWSTKRWVKVGHRLGRAWSKAGTASLRPSATHRWAKSVARLRKGVLVFRVNGVDRLNNTSRWLVHSQKLTR